jgi:hypothetical protein
MDYSHDFHALEEIRDYFKKNPAVTIEPTEEFIHFCQRDFNFTTYFGKIKPSYSGYYYYKYVNEEIMCFIRNIWSRYHAEYLEQSKLEIERKNQQILLENQRKLDRILALLEKKSDDDLDYAFVTAD